jgi:hypothetical protein
VLRIVCCILVVGCGSTGNSPPPATATRRSAATVAPTTDRVEQREQDDRETLEQKDAIAATHRVAELEQQNAMDAACTEPKPWNKHERCLPSCYPTEEPDKRAEMKLVAAMEVQHVVCKRNGEVPYAVVDEIAGAKLRVQPVRGRLPKPHRKGSWQAAVETWFRDEHVVKVPKTDLVVVKSAWSNRSHPINREKMSCLMVSHYAEGMRGKLDECGVPAKSGVTCEAAGNGAARALNVAHYRLVEAKRLQRKPNACQQAALEVIAIARGLPRWRQYKKLNVDQWNDKLVYKTRFDGMLDEDGLFAAVAALGTEAEAVHASCGGSPGATTTVDQEQSFHMCW